MCFLRLLPCYWKSLKNNLILVHTIAGLRVIPSPSVEAAVGDEVVLTCEVTEYSGTPSISWYKDEELLTPDDDSEPQYVSVSESGQYSCGVSLTNRDYSSAEFLSKITTLVLKRKTHD